MLIDLKLKKNNAKWFPKCKELVTQIQCVQISFCDHFWRPKKIYYLGDLKNLSGDSNGIKFRGTFLNGVLLKPYFNHFRIYF